MGSFTVSHETIYQFIYDDERHGGTLFKHLRIVTKTHRKRYRSRDSRGILPGKRHKSGHQKWGSACSWVIGKATP
jgi:transposase, IS30 family